MSTNFQWLGAEVVLRGGNLYRGRYAVFAPFGCGQIPLSAFRSAFLAAFATAAGGAPRFPADLVVYTDAASLPADWPSDRRTFAVGAGECPVWWEARASSDVTLDDSAFSTLPGVRLIDYWQQPPGGLTPGIPQAPCPPGTVFDPTKNGCVTASQPSCPPGTAWNQDFGVCVPQIQSCPAGQRWWFYEEFVDQPGGGGKCVPEDCPGGTERNPSTGECVAPTAIENCPAGFDFDEATGLCIEHEATPPVPVPSPSPTPTPTPSPAPSSVPAPKKKSNTPIIVAAATAAAVALYALGRAG